MNIRLFFVAAFCIVISGCGSRTGFDAAKNRSYPYFTSLPSRQTMSETYTQIRHTVSPIDAYHFSIMIPTEWKTLDIVADAEPLPGNFKEMGVFRQPGNWMNSETSAPNAEITVTVVNAKNDKKWASVWLEDTLARNAAKYEILEKRNVETEHGDALDMLVSYSDGEQKIINRIAAFRDDDSIFVISGSDTVNGYRDTAEAMYVAIESFRLASDSVKNPFSEK